MQNNAVRFVLVLTLLGNCDISSADMNTSPAGEENSETWSTLPTETMAGDVDQTKRDMSEARSSVARLTRYIRNLPTSQERVAPFVMDDLGNWVVDIEAVVAVVSVVGVDDVKESMTSGLSISLRWIDASLAWNTSENLGLKEIQVPADAIWTPYLSLGNSHDMSKMRGMDHVFVKYDGQVDMVIPVYVETQCSLDLTHYPYDEQTCPVIIMSFGENIRWNIEHSPQFSEKLSSSLEIGSGWEMVNTRVQLVQVSVEEKQRLDVKILLHLRRKTTFYTVCLVLPMVMTSYMNTLVFLLPPESGENISFLVSIFVSTSVFLSYFTSVMPRGLDSVPSTMRLLLGVIIESLLVLLATIVVLRRYHKQQKPNEQVELPKADQTEAHSSATDGSQCMNRFQILNMKAEILNGVFFVLAFVGNTCFLAVLLYQSLSKINHDGEI